MAEFSLWDEIEKLGYKNVDVIEEDYIYYVKIDDEYDFQGYDREVFEEIKTWHESRNI